MTRPDKWMPFYWSDWWKETGALDEIEGFALFNLIGAYWVNGGPLPADDARLRRLSKCSERNWERVRALVLGFFREEDGKLIHDRTQAQLITQTANYEKRRACMDLINARRSSRGAHGDRARSPSRISEPEPDSPNGESHDSPAIPRRSRTKAKRTQLDEGWTPDEDGVAYGRALGLTDDEMERERRSFVRYWRSADAAGGGLKADWAATWKNRLDAVSARIVASRPCGKTGVGAGASPDGRLGGRGLVDTVARLKLQAREQGQDEQARLRGRGGALHRPEDERGHAGESDRAGGGGDSADAA